jgi:hypothetical protein
MYPETLPPESMQAVRPLLLKWMLTDIFWMEHRAPNEGARESTQGVNGLCNPIGGTTI